MRAKWVKRPVEIEAVQWTGDNWDEVFDFVGPSLFMHSAPAKVLIIRTLEGAMEALTGDYIIKGIKNEFYPCREDIFLETYDRADGA